MQERLHHLAVKLVWVQPLAVLVAGLALLGALFVAVNPDPQLEAWLIPAILIFCWSLLVVTLINMFQASPPVIDDNTRFFRRQVIRFHRMLRNLFAMVFLALSLALFYLSYKLVVTGVG